MGYIFVCDKCGKRIRERPYVSVDFGLDGFAFHPACAPSIVKVLKPLIERKNARKRKKS